MFFFWSSFPQRYDAFTRRLSKLYSMILKTKHLSRSVPLGVTLRTFARCSISHVRIVSQYGICSAITRPISREAVAAGEGALQTWIAHGPLTIRKSSTKPPSGRKACARTPDSPGVRSSAQTSGISFCRLSTNAFLLKDRCISSSPALACLLASRQNPA